MVLQGPNTALPTHFEKDWDSISLTAYQQQNLDKYLHDHIYSVAREVGWTPKDFRKGKNTKKPPSKTKLKSVGASLKASEELEQALTQIKEVEVPEDQRSFIPPHITNLNGACYFHPYMKKTEVPEDREAYLNELTKIVDCEVIVEECVEFLIKQPGQTEEDKVVKYRLRLTNREDKHVKTIATHEDITTKTRFSSFLVSKGFVNFLAEKFNLWESFNGRLNIRVTLGYAIACLYSRKAMELADDGFPILYKYGERGTGKSSSMDWFMALFGYRNGNRQAVSKKNTVKGISRQITKINSFPFFMDDYRDHKTNSGVPDMTSSFLHWFHRTGSTMAMKSADHQTVDTPSNACIVMTGNDKPTDPAARSRLILLTYNNFIKEQIVKLPEITNHIHRFSEFAYLILSSFDEIEGYFMRYLQENLKVLANEEFQGRTVKIWPYVMAGIQCIPHIIPDLNHWGEEFEGLREEIIEAIKKEVAQQKEFNPLHEFFQTIEYYGTQKLDAASEFNRKFNVLDHRHFRYKAFKEFDHNGSVYQGEVLYLHLTRVWQTLEAEKAEITKKTTLEALTNKLENSSYFLASSEQIQLTSSIDQSNKETNRRCHVLNIKQLEEKEMLLELIERAKEYEQGRPSRLSP